MTQGSDRAANRALQARFEQVHEQYTRLRAGLADMQARLTELRATASSEDGHVTAVVGARGHLVELELDQRIYRDQDAAELAAKITETVRRATAKAADDASAVLAEYMPAGSPAMGFMRDNDFATMLDRFDGAATGADPDVR